MVDKVLHVSDIHIRNYQRHKEYISVFEQLYAEVDKLPENAIVYVGGDIVHSKTDISPELIKVTSDFLNNLANRRLTIVITGNHDANLNNSSRLDTLSPIIEAIGNPNLYYLKDSGVYEIGNVHFTVFSIFDDPETFIKADSFEAETKVALFHGAIHNSVTDVGFYVKNGELPVSIFDGYDMSMLGDIHKRQFYDKANTILQVGSLVQQNFGESFENHGCAIWDVAKRKASFKNFVNDYGYYTIDVDGPELPELKDLPKFPRVRLRVTNATQAEITNMVKEVRSMCKPADVVVLRGDKIDSKGNSKKAQVAVRDIRDTSYQNELLEEYVTEHHEVDQDTLDQLFKITRTLNQSLTGSEVSRNINWKPKRFEFSNMFSYGENNVVDFDKTEGLIGLFAANHSGKSALLDALSFCVFDKCSRGKTAADILNNKSVTFSCKLHFEVEGQDYFIERTAKKSTSGHKAGSVKVLVDFWTVEAGEIQSLNGEQRRDTNRNIKQLLGTYEDFILTSLSVQNNNTGFIDMRQNEKKDLLAQFLDITVFEELHKLATDEIREAKTLLKNFKSVDYDEQLVEKEQLLETLKVRQAEVDQAVESARELVTNINEQIASLNADLVQIDESTNLEELETSKARINDELETNETRLQDYVGFEQENQEKFAELGKVLEGYDFEELTKVCDLLDRASDKHRDFTQQLEIIKNSVMTKQDHLNSFGEFDPNCEFCVKRAADAAEASKQLEAEIKAHKKEGKAILAKRTKAEEFMSQYESARQDLAAYNEARTELDTFERYQAEIEVKKVKRESAITELKADLEKVENLIEYHLKNEESIKRNAEIQSEIASQKDVLAEAKGSVRDSIAVQQDVTSDVKVTASQIEAINEAIEQAHELEVKIKAYQYYIDAVQRDGIPYTLISEALPQIEEEVNEALSHIVDFTLEFDVNSKDIVTSIVYGDDNKWALELTSGMEKFISSLAIRVALANISNLPRPSFLAIDEGMGNLDSTNLASLGRMFEYFKEIYDTVLVISHIDAVKDFVDDSLQIEVNEGFSRIVHE